MACTLAVGRPCWFPGDSEARSTVDSDTRQGCPLSCSRKVNAASGHPPQDVREMMEHLEGALQSTETGQDLCSSRRLQRQHRQQEGKSQALASKMAALISQTHNVFTSWTILEESQKCQQR